MARIENNTYLEFDMTEEKIYLQIHQLSACHFLKNTQTALEPSKIDKCQKWP